MHVHMEVSVNPVPDPQTWSLRARFRTPRYFLYIHTKFQKSKSTCEYTRNIVKKVNICWCNVHVYENLRRFPVAPASCLHLKFKWYCKTSTLGGYFILVEA